MDDHRYPEDLCEVLRDVPVCFDTWCALGLPVWPRVERALPFLKVEEWLERHQRLETEEVVDLYEQLVESEPLSLWYLCPVVDC